MRFVFRIWSNYDGFTPDEIPNRMVPEDVLKLRWDRYIDQIEPGDEVWIYFHGPHKFQNGIYIKGGVQEVDLNNQAVFLRVREYSTNTPLTISETARQIAELVQVRKIQAFLVPQEWQPTPDCTALTTANSCRERLCELCPVWENEFPRAKEYQTPERMGDSVSAFVTAYWVIPRRCYWKTASIKRGIRKTTELFTGFKTGQRSLAYPLAIGMYHALREADLLKTDAIVPVPLSPDKKERGELHRTLALAREMSRLLESPVRQALTLNTPISKRNFLNSGGTTYQFELKYAEAMEAKSVPRGRVLLVDDVGTRGSTLDTCARAIRAIRESEVIALTAGLMTLKRTVSEQDEILA